MKIVGILLSVLSAIVTAASPELRALVKDSVAKWEVQAQKTPNQLDNVLVELVKNLLGL